MNNGGVWRHERDRRPNPFVFPSDTDFRFWLLVVIVLGSSFFCYFFAYRSFPRSRQRWDEGYRNCATEVGIPNEVWDRFLRSDSEAAEVVLPFSPVIQECMSSVRLDTALRVLACTALFAIGTIVLFVLSPRRRIRRNHMTPLGDEHRKMAAYLDILCDEANLPRCPVYLIDSNLGGAGLAFGSIGRRFIALGTGLVVMFGTDRPSFAAIVRHELAHVRNADINKTYLAVSAWTAFVVLALVPYGFSIAVPVLYGTTDGWTTLIRAFPAFVLGILVYSTRNALLRSRELYADVRASIWDGPDGVLRQVLEKQPPPRREWLRVLRRHPTFAERRQTLDDTSRLLRMGHLNALGTGIASSFALPSVVTLVELTPATDLGGVAVWAGSVTPFFAFAVAAIGTAAWRSAFASSVGVGKVSNPGRLGLAFGLGFVVGGFVSFEAFQAVAAVLLPEATSQFSLPELAQSSLAYAQWVGVVLIGFVLFSKWVALGARAWLEWVATVRLIHIAFWISLMLAVAISSSWTGMFIIARDMDTAGFVPNLLTFLVQYASYSPLTFVTFAMLSAFPLFAYVWHRRLLTSGERAWAFLDPTAPPQRIMHQDPPRFTVPIIAGSVGGLTIWLMLLVARLSTWGDGGSTWPTWFAYRMQVLAAVAVQVIIALVIFQRSRSHSFLRGLCAATACGCIAAAGTIAVRAGYLNLPFIWSTLNLIVVGGTISATVPLWLLARLRSPRQHSALAEDSDASREVLTAH